MLQVELITVLFNVKDKGQKTFLTNDFQRKSFVFRQEVFCR